MERSRFFNLQSDFYTYSFPKFCSMFLKFKQKIKNYGVTGSWTQGLLHAKQALYQLSYNPVSILFSSFKTNSECFTLIIFHCDVFE